jgi:hypothetical protein
MSDRDSDSWTEWCVSLPFRAVVVLGRSSRPRAGHQHFKKSQHSVDCCEGSRIVPVGIVTTDRSLAWQNVGGLEREKP